MNITQFIIMKGSYQALDISKFQNLNHLKKHIEVRMMVLLLLYQIHQKIQNLVLLQYQLDLCLVIFLYLVLTNNILYIHIDVPKAIQKEEVFLLMLYLKLKHRENLD